MTPTTRPVGVGNQALLRQQQQQQQLDATLRSTGRPLAASLPSVHPTVAARLGEVRVHDDGGAAIAADALDAHAFSHGNHVFFGAGRFEPTTAAGRELIAHEAIHAIQARTSTSASGLGDAEREATTLAPHLARGEPVAIRASAAGIQRSEMPAHEVRRRNAARERDRIHEIDIEVRQIEQRFATSTLPDDLAQRLHTRRNELLDERRAASQDLAAATPPPVVRAVLSAADRAIIADLIDRVGRARAGNLAALGEPGVVAGIVGYLRALIARPDIAADATLRAQLATLADLYARAAMPAFVAPPPRYDGPSISADRRGGIRVSDDEIARYLAGGAHPIVQRQLDGLDVLESAGPVGVGVMGYGLIRGRDIGQIVDAVGNVAPIDTGLQQIAMAMGNRPVRSAPPTVRPGATGNRPSRGAPPTLLGAETEMHWGAPTRLVPTTQVVPRAATAPRPLAASATYHATAIEPGLDADTRAPATAAATGPAPVVTNPPAVTAPPQPQAQPWRPSRHRGPVLTYVEPVLLTQSPQTEIDATRAEAAAAMNRSRELGLHRQTSLVTRVPPPRPPGTSEVDWGPGQCTTAAAVQTLRQIGFPGAVALPGTLEGIQRANQLLQLIYGARFQQGTFLELTAQATARPPGTLVVISTRTTPRTASDEPEFNHMIVARVGDDRQLRFMHNTPYTEIDDPGMQTQRVMPAGVPNLGRMVVHTAEGNAGERTTQVMTLRWRMLTPDQQAVIRAQLRL